MGMFTAIFSNSKKTGNNIGKCKKLWHIHTMEYNKAVNMEELKLLHQRGSQSMVN